MPSFIAKIRDYFSSSIKSTKFPFTTQSELITRYNLGTHDDGSFVAMCQAMTYHYVSLVLEGKNPSEHLDDGTRFLYDSLAKENETADEREINGSKDEDHRVFDKYNIAHEDQQHSFKELTPEKLLATVEDRTHVLLTCELPNNTAHVVYLGKKESEANKPSTCRFFDANIYGGERIKSCEEMVPFILNRLKEKYSLDDEAPCKLGIPTKP